MKVTQRLNALFAEIAKEVRSNPAFAERIEHVLEPREIAETSSPPRSKRRKPAVIDPFAEFANGEAALRTRLASLDLEALRDVLAEYGMDRAKLAMKWKDQARIIDLIVKSVAARASKGNAFRNIDR